MEQDFIVTMEMVAMDTGTGGVGYEHVAVGDVTGRLSPLATDTGPSVWVHKLQCTDHTHMSSVLHRLKPGRNQTIRSSP